MFTKIGAACTLICASILSGCASTQLNYNTIDVAGTVGDIFTRQALTNLSMFVDDPYAIPSQLDISAGTIQTVNTIQPGLSFPLSSQVVNTATQAASLTVAKADTTAGVGATLSGTNTQQQNWNITPLTDANTLRNLQAIYRYAIYGTSLTDEEYGYHPSRVFVGNKFYLDPYQLEQPHCVLCTSTHTILDPDAEKHVTPNKRLRPRWLYWTSDAGAGRPAHLPNPELEPVVDLGHFGHHELYISKKKFEEGYLSDFVFFILPNSEPVEVFASTTDNGGQHAGGAGGGGPGKDAAAIAPSTNGRVSAGPGRHNLNVYVAPLGIQ